MSKQLKMHQVAIALSILFALIACSSSTKQADSGVSKEPAAKAAHKANRRPATINVEKSRFIANLLEDADGSVKGFRCVSLLEEAKNPFAKAGIQVDDVVLAVNDRELTTTEDASYYFGQIRKNTYSSIKIQRGQRIFTLKRVAFSEEEG